MRPIATDEPVAWCVSVWTIGKISPTLYPITVRKPRPNLKQRALGPHSKQNLDLFIRFCTARTRVAPRYSIIGHKRGARTVNMKVEVDEVLSCSVGGHTSVDGSVDHRDRMNDKPTPGVTQLNITVVTRVDQLTVSQPDHSRRGNPAHGTVKYLSSVDDCR